MIARKGGMNNNMKITIKKPTIDFFTVPLNVDLVMAKHPIIFTFKVTHGRAHMLSGVITLPMTSLIDDTIAEAGWQS